jgi:hypothetical protein
MVKKWLIRAVLTLVAFLAVFNVFMYWLMTRPPEQFAQGVARLPQPMMMLSPFPVLWNSARGGKLQIGDQAPDFNLSTFDRSATVQLSQNRGVRPVVLVFGSYT